MAAITSSDVKAVASIWVASEPSREAVSPWGPFSSLEPGASIDLTGIVQWRSVSHQAYHLVVGHLIQKFLPLGIS